MIFVDTNVFMYAVGKEHDNRAPAQQFFRDAVQGSVTLCTSAEVLQELIHVYVRRGDDNLLDAAFTLIQSMKVSVWPLEEQDVRLAKDLRAVHPDLQARDLCHLASCQRRGVESIKTFEEPLGAVLIRSE